MTMIDAAVFVDVCRTVQRISVVFGETGRWAVALEADGTISIRRPTCAPSATTGCLEPPKDIILIGVSPESAQQWCNGVAYALSALEPTRTAWVKTGNGR